MAVLFFDSVLFGQDIGDINKGCCLIGGTLVYLNLIDSNVAASPNMANGIANPVSHSIVRTTTMTNNIIRINRAVCLSANLSNFSFIFLKCVFTLILILKTLEE